MKKILSLLLVLAACVFVLASCSEEIGSYLSQYDYEKKELQPITLNVYIPCGAGTSENAKITVERMITQYTEQKFKTTLNIEYVPDDASYESVILTKVQGDAENRADLVLANSAELVTRLNDAGLAVDLTSFLESDAYGKLNTQIAQTLLEASKIGKVLPALPNNHVVGEYTYLLIDKAVARDQLHYNNALLSSYKTYEETADLRADIESTLSLNAVDYVKVVTGAYEDKARYEDDGYFCNVVAYPAATAEDAFSSAFVIVGGTKDAGRVMEILYAINTDEYLRNTLQYGVKGTNYTLDEETDEVVRLPAGDNDCYEMNLLYTGDVFKAYFCSELGWNADAAKYGKMQNDQSVFEK